MLELRELLSLPRLGLQLRAFPEGRTASIRWAHIFEDMQDIDACAGGELVLTRARWRRSPADADRFACALSQRGAAALGVQPSGSVLDELVVACERWQLPLVSIPPAIDLEEIAETTITMALHRHNAGAMRIQARHRAVLAQIGTPDGIPALLALLADDLACPVWLLAGATSVPATGSRPLSDADVAALAAAVADRRGSVELVAEHGGPLSALPVGSTKGRAAAHIVAGVPSAELTSDDRAAIEQIRLALERQLAVLRAGRAARRPTGTEFLRRAAAGAASGHELDAWTRALGLRAGGHVVCVVAQAPAATPEDVERLCDALDEMAELQSIDRVVTCADTEVCALLFAGAMSERVDDQVVRASSVLGPALTALGGAIGRSSVMAQGPADVLRMIHDARRVCQLNFLREPDPEPIQRQPDAPLSALLLMHNEDALRSLHEVMLQPLIDYDREHRSELVRTLDVFLTTGGQWSASAAELGVHVNTLRYRLTRIQKCTGRDPTAMADRVDFYVALRARQARRLPDPSPYSRL